MKVKFKEFLQKKLTNSHLISYGIKKQFIELEFTNSNYEEIMFFVDCKIMCDNNEIIKLIEPLKKGCIDTYDISYFTFVNLKSISNCFFDKMDNLVVKFENNVQIIFDVNSVEDSDISITFRKTTTDQDYISVELFPNGIFETNNPGNIVGNVSD